MTIKSDVDFFIKTHSGPIMEIMVDCTKRGGRRIFGGDEYEGYKLKFVGKSKENKRRAERQRIEKFKAAQIDAFEGKSLG